MKNLLSLSILLIIAVSSVAQVARLKEGPPLNSEPKGPGKGNNSNPVTVITIGTSSTAFGNVTNSHGGQEKTMLWADDTLKALVNIHPTGTGFSNGCYPALAGDLGVNMGLTAADWTADRQIYAGTMSAGADGIIWPQGAIYSPPGNTSLANAWCVYFSPNGTSTYYGGFSHGSDNLVNQADSSKSFYWFNPPPWTYVPYGFTVTQKGIALMTDRGADLNWNYTGDIILGRGVWNPALKGFEYTLSSIQLPTTDNGLLQDEKIAASPDGNTVWIVALANSGWATQTGYFKNYYPVLFKSTDGGLTWGNAISVQLDGPDGIDGVKNFMSDYRIHQLFTPPYPARDQIGYSTAYDCDLSVDKWGNPHVAVVIGVTASDYTMSTSDSSFCVFDIYSTNRGTSWKGVVMGHPWTFRGTFGSFHEDNDVQIASTEAGDKMFVTWLDTQIPGNTNNNAPDVFSRGFDLVTNKVTSNGGDQPDNVTWLSDVFQQAYFQRTAHYVFTGNSKYTIPIVTELMSDPYYIYSPVTFKYIPDFSYKDADFSIPVPNAVFPVSTDQIKEDVTSVMVYPNPVKDVVRITVNLSHKANVSFEITNLVGQPLMSINKGELASGSNHFTVDAGNLQSGAYLLIMKVNGQKYSRKMIVE